jgi:phytoene dehydrogenase-like protein
MSRHGLATQDMHHLKKHYDAVIVGGGHNGLIAACYLGQAGLSVLLLEKQDHLGGATVSTPVFARYDARLSRYAYLVSLLSPRVITELGLRFRSKRRRIGSCTPYLRDGVPGALLLSNVDAGAARASFEALAGGEDWLGYQRLLKMERAFAKLVYPSLLQPLRTRQAWKASLRDKTARAAWDAFVEQPIGEVIERLIQDDVARGVVFTDAKIGIHTHAHDRSLLQNRCFIMHVIGNGTGEWRVPVGGMGALVAELTDAARRSGVELLTGAEARAISLGAPAHSVSFEHEGAEYGVSTTRVLVGAGPQVFDRLLGREHHVRPADQGSVCKVNMLLRGLPRLKAGVAARDAFAGTFHIDESYSQLETSFRQADSGSLPSVPPAELYCHTLTDDTILARELRAAGYQTLTLFGLDAPYASFEHDAAKKKAVMLDRYLAGLNKLLAEPIEDYIAQDAYGAPCVEIKCPQDLERDLTLYRGNIFHGELSWFFAEDGQDQSRWGVESEFARVYRCGSSAQRGGAVSGVPGHNAAQCVFEEIGMSRPDMG